jgi:hypothetical protein
MIPTPLGEPDQAGNPTIVAPDGMSLPERCSTVGIYIGSTARDRRIEPTRSGATRLPNPEDVWPSKLTSLQTRSQMTSRLRSSSNTTDWLDPSAGVASDRTNSRRLERRLGARLSRALHTVSNPDHGRAGRRPDRMFIQRQRCAKNARTCRIGRVRSGGIQPTAAGPFVRRIDGHLARPPD